MSIETTADELSICLRRAGWKLARDSGGFPITDNTDHPMWIGPYDTLVHSLEVAVLVELTRLVRERMPKP